MTIKVSELAAKVKEIGEANPDVVYQDIEEELTGNAESTCQYQLNGTPACIVGQALSELGVDIETLQRFDNWLGNGSEAIDTVVRDLPQIFECDSLDALYYTRDAQCNQDAGETWGEAVAQ